jgi:hypothetical protein
VAPTLIKLNGGTLDGSMRVTVGGAMNWTAGSMTGTGRTIIPPGVILGITNPAAIYMDHRTLENGGTIYCTGTGDIDGSAGAVITNRPGALFSVQNSANFVGSPGTSPRLDNAGTFRKSLYLTTMGP